MKEKKERFWEIDTLRGIAIIMMIIFHILYDLDTYNILMINLRIVPIRIFNYSIGTIFLLLVGISLYLSYSRVSNVYSNKQLQLKFLKRGMKIFSLGMIITLITWFFLPDGFIIFGVLHCIGLSIILGFPFLKYHYQNLFFGLLLILIGLYLWTFTFDFSWLLWLGFIPSGFFTIDYFPILPWFGIVLIGIFVGNTLFRDYNRQYKIRDLSIFFIIRWFVFLGKNSLKIYFVHQPIIIGLILIYVNI